MTDKIKMPPSRLCKISLSMMIFLFTLSAFMFYSQLYIAAYLDLGAGFIQLASLSYRFYLYNKLHIKYRKLIKLQNIINIPCMQTIGNSIILTFLTPDKELLDFMKEK